MPAPPQGAAMASVVGGGAHMRDARARGEVRYGQPCSHHGAILDSLQYGYQRLMSDEVPLVTDSRGRRNETRGKRC